MKTITSLSGWTLSPESNWTKGVFGFGLTFPNLNTAEIQNQINAGKCHLSVKIPETNELTTPLMLDEQNITTKPILSPFLPNGFNKERIEELDIDIFGSLKSNNLIIYLKCQNPTTQASMAYITGCKIDPLSSSSIPLPHMLQIPDISISSIDVSSNNIQLRLNEDSSNTIIGKASNINPLNYQGTYFDIPYTVDSSTPTTFVAEEYFLISKESNPRVFVSPEKVEFYTPLINKITSINNGPISHIDSITKAYGNNFFRKILVHYSNKIVLFTLTRNLSNGSSTITEETISSSTTGVEQIFLLSDSGTTSFEVGIKTTNGYQKWKKQGTTWTNYENPSGDFSFINKINNTVVLAFQDEQLTDLHTVGTVSITSYLGSFNEFIEDNSIDTNNITKLLFVENIDDLYNPMCLILVSREDEYEYLRKDLFTINCSLPEIPISNEIGIWNHAGYIRFKSRSLFSLIEVNTDDDAWSLGKINRSEVLESNYPNIVQIIDSLEYDIHIKFNKNIHNISFNDLINNSTAQTASQRFCLSPFRFPSIEELKNEPYNIKFPDDFNYFSFLGNTFDNTTIENVSMSSGNIGSKLPENLKFFRNFINNSHIIDYISYNDDADQCRLKIENGFVRFNPSYKSTGVNPPSPNPAGLHEVILLSIGNSNDLNNPFIWFESNAMGFVGVRQEGNVFTIGSRSAELDHFNNQALWMECFPHVINDTNPNTSSQSFYDQQSSNTQWQTNKQNSKELGDYHR